MQSHHSTRPWAALAAIALAALIPSSIAASDRPPKATDFRPTMGVALGDWFVDEGGHVVCQSPGSRCLMIYGGPVQIHIPLASPF